MNTQAGTYPLRVTAWFTNYATNVVDKDFTIVIEENCETAMVVTTSAGIGDESFIVARPAIISGAFAEFTASPAHCYVSGYMYTVTPTLVSPDDAAIEFDPVLRSFTIQTDNILLVGDYDVRVTALTPDGADTGTGWNWTASI